MSRLALVLLAVAGGAIMTDGSLLDLYDMIEEVTGENAVVAYSFYGCYCGWGGMGRPKDQTDWCCQRHDCCYDQLDKQGCETKAESYSYTHHSGKVTCWDSPSQWETKQKTGAWCQRQTCECDKKFVQCLKKHLRTYRATHLSYLNDPCPGPSPPCSS